ncbi:S8 family peptidase [Tardiphaga sp. vice352]|uniref:S8 family peptidase n=1 Tax=Tardiphaga sp. vice352 TaxID=2592816 RepID=UPI0011636984|nr:S8 family peptidase [Tardiphaga sp. vice352]QDM32862.1 S8 family peptidase [Tardiphaga sp. vice352]
MPSRFNLPHIDIIAFATAQDYVGEQGGGSGAVRQRAAHGRRVQDELRVALAAADSGKPTDARLEAPSGIFVEVELRRGTSPDALDMKTQDIRTGAVKLNDANNRVIALYVPDHARPVLDQILTDYLNGPLSQKGNNPPNKTKVESIEAIRTARLETFWTDAPEALPTGAQDQIWWALWCYRDKEADIEDVCTRLELRAADTDRRLYFPEIVVVPVFATRAAIELMLFATGAIAELRRANDTPVFFTDDVEGEQHEWTDGLAERIVWPGAEAPAVCIFDTGVNRGHSLIEPALATRDMHTLDRDWGTDDHDPSGHGTSMAGMALHGDLTAALADASERRLIHRLESVKLLPPEGFDETEPQSYGILTQAAVALPEIEAPERPRIYCMAVTNDNVSGASASGWSAALDQAAVGRMIADDDDEEDEEKERPKRLIIVSAGNVLAETDFTRRRSQDEYPIEDPAQAWNALTVGGYTDLINVRDKGYEDWSAAAAVGELSPHSRTSVTWPQGLSPFKPELVMEAGNRAVNPGRTEILTVGSLSLLTTGSEAEMPLVPFEATSAAAAQAARMAARLTAQHPDYWPETIRAMMVHSAEWTEPMLKELGETPGKKARYELVRRFGYGVPNFDRANASALNHLALFAQANIHPFKMHKGRKFNECHYYTLPIPRDMLEKLENEVVEMKITLSYFIDPNPGLSANLDPQRYQSHGLRFDHQRKNESVPRFKLRVNPSEREDPRRRPAIEPADTRWMLGEDSISAGSLHCDVWTGPAIELLNRDTICVKPVNGWWRSRASTEIVNRKSRYALIVTLKARNTELDIYTPVRTSIGLPVPVEVETLV